MRDIPETIQGLQLYIEYAKKEIVLCDKRKVQLQKELVECGVRLLAKGGKLVKS